jgi:general secretion pathway protein D
MRLGTDIAAAPALCVLLALAACTSQKPRPPPSAAELAQAATAEQQAHAAAPPMAQPLAEQPQSEIIPGTGRLMGSAVPRAQSSIGEDGSITLNFINADVRDVAKAVLGDFLGLNFALGAGVQGNITVQTSKPLARSEVLPVFEQILHMNGLSLIHAGDVYKIVLNADAPREAVSAGPVGTAQAGFGSQIVPLRFISVAEMQKLLEPMQPSQAIVHADTGRNLLIIQGTQQERQAIVDQIALFDVDWLRGMSFGLFTPKYTDARGLAHELSQILGGAGGPLSGIVKLVPLERLNTVLVISPQPRYLAQVQRWVERLDRPGVGSDRRIFVYAVQNGRASDLASVLKKVLYGTSGRSGAKGGTGAEASEEGEQGYQMPPPPAASSTGGFPTSGAPASAASPETNNQSSVEDSQDDTSAAPPGHETITADEANNAIVVYGTPQEYSVIENALHQLDTAPLQVLLEAAIAEVTLTNDLRYGVQWFYQPNNEHTFVNSNIASAAISSTLPGFSYVFAQGTNIKVILDTLSTITHIDVVSSPDILVLNNHTATLQVGNQVPIATAQAVGVAAAQAPIVNAIQYQSTGVVLKVTPRVNQGGMVMMDISQEVSNASPTTTSNIDSPTIAQRRIDSTIAIQDNETIALGGLITDSTTHGTTGLPLLSEIPVLGGLFGTQNRNIDRTELIVLITPHVVDNLQKARAVTDELRRKLPSVETLLEK